MRWFGNAGCVSIVSLEELLPHADGKKEAGEEGEDDEGCSEAEGRAQDEAQVALASFC